MAQQVVKRVAERVALELKERSHHRSFPLFVGLLLSLDFAVLILPSTPVVLAACLLQPRRWWSVALAGAVGAALGGTALGAVVQGASHWFFHNFPLHQNPSYLELKTFIENYGAWGLFGLSSLPVSIRTAIVVAVAGGMPLMQVALTVVLGRCIAYGVLGYLVSRAPGHLLKIRAVRESPLFSIILKDKAP